jgi:hypothetical protein
MASLLSLLVPILLSAVLVFFASFIIHMVLTYHRTDLRKLPDEDGVMAALRPFSIPPGDYAVPSVRSPAEMKDPKFIEKRNKGPVAFMTVVPPGPVSMGQSLLLWFLYSCLVGLFAAYIASRMLAPGTAYRAVFRLVGTTAFMGYSLALLQNSIWWKRNWGMTLKSMFDGLIYALLTAGVFGWLWPR